MALAWLALALVFAGGAFLTPGLIFRLVACVIIVKLFVNNGYVVFLMSPDQSTGLPTRCCFNDVS